MGVQIICTKSSDSYLLFTYLLSILCVPTLTKSEVLTAVLPIIQVFLGVMRYYWFRLLL